MRKIPAYIGLTSYLSNKEVRSKAYIEEFSSSHYYEGVIDIQGNRTGNLITKTVIDFLTLLRFVRHRQDWLLSGSSKF